MKENLDRRALAAVRWLDAVTGQPVLAPLVVESTQLRFVHNRSGLAVVVGAQGLQAYEECFDLAKLPDTEQITALSLTGSATVTDPSGAYLPRKFTLALPRVAAPPRNLDGSRPANSLFTPVDVPLLPSPLAKVASGWAQIRVSARTTGDKPLRNLYLRVVSRPAGQLLGRGMTDDRGEGLVIVAGLRLFAPGPTPEEMVTTRTLVRLEAIASAEQASPIDWTGLDAVPADPANQVDLVLEAGRTYSQPFPF